MNDCFFGVQLAVLSRPHDPWRETFAQLVRKHTRDLSLADKRSLYGSAVNLLRPAAERFVSGFWDLVEDGAAEFEEWTTGVEDDAKEFWVDDEEATPDRVLVTMVFLLPEGTAAARLAGDRCDLPESAWRTRRTYLHLLETVGMLPFASVRSDAIYLTPGGTRHAFSARELAGEGYEYLLPIESGRGAE